MAGKKDLSLKKKINRAVKKSQKAGPSHTPLYAAGAVAAVGLLLIGVSFAAGKPVSTVLLIAGGLAVCAGLVLGGIFLFPSQDPGKLVYREDAVELVRKGSKGSAVVGRLPFANVATVEIASIEVKFKTYRIRSIGEMYAYGMFEQEEDSGGKIRDALLVTLYKPKDRETWWPTRTHKDDTFDVIIFDDFDQPLTTVQRNILAGVKEYLTTKTKGGRTPRQGT